MPRKVILDVDPGHNNAVAIMLAVLSPDIDLLGVSVTYGNRPLEVTVANALRVIDWLEVDIPVFRGAADPPLSFVPSVLHDIHHTALDVTVNPGGPDDGRTIVDLRPGDWEKGPFSACCAISADREKFVRMLTEILGMG